jgi:4-amino-4-deoxy-L-arabinose transferase-like glycosyltransferase
MAMLGKLALAGLSSDGMHIVPTKIASINTNFFNISKVIDDEGVFHFLKTFNGRQSGLGFHADTHPPLPLLIYWTLRRAFFGSYWGAALGVMALNAAAVFPWYHLGKRLGGASAGIAAAALFLSSPLTLILGNAGIDSVAFSAVSFGAYCIVAALQDDDWKRALQGGAFIAVAANCSFAANSSLVFLGTWGLLLAWRARTDFTQFLILSLKVWGLVTAGMLGVHLFFVVLSGGGFSYLGSIRSAQFAHMQANLFRVYELWSWANCLLYGGYAGLGLLTLWLGCLAASLWRADTRDTAVIAGGAFVLTVVLAAFGRAEVQRQFLFGAVALIPAACLPARKGWILTAAIALNVINAVFLQANVLDYW